MINTNKLKGLMREREITQEYLAKTVGIRQSTLNLKLNNKRHMFLDEAEKIARVLDISDTDFKSYFFAN